MVNRTLARLVNQFSERIEQEEWLDEGAGTQAEVCENLAEMHQINQRLGGSRALMFHLLPRLKRLNRPAALLDLGTGGAGLPLVIVEQARRMQIPVCIVAVDLSARILAAARQNLPYKSSIHLVQADALCLPLAEGQVDFVVSSLFLHHFNPLGVAALLRQASAYARQAVIMSDLVRGWMPYAAFRLVQPVFARSRLTRHDGALSIRRAYTPAELTSLARQAGLARVKVYSHFPWRMTLVADK